MDKNKLTKIQLIKLCEHYEYQLTLLDLMINNMSNIEMSDIQQWLDDNVKLAQEIYTEKNILKFDKDNYTQITVYDALEQLEDKNENN